MPERSAEHDVKRSNPLLPAFFFLVSLGLTLAVLASVESVKVTPTPPLVDIESTDGINAADFGNAVASFRNDDFSAAEADLLLRIESGSPEASLLLGLYANAAERNAVAIEHLRAAESYGGELADWRLWALADSAQTLGQTTLARAVLTRLVADYPSSPLTSSSVGLLATWAAERDDQLGVLELVDDAYGPNHDGDTRGLLAMLAWEAANSLQDPAARRAAAVRLLVDHPLAASELAVIDLFRGANGEVDWPTFLSARNLVQRSKSLLEAKLPESALETLAEVPAEQRDLSWGLAKARSLIAARQGEEALATLDGLSGQSTLDQIEIEWERGRAAIEISTPRRGRGHLDADQRNAMRDRAHGHLRRVIEAGDERYAARSLRILFADLLEDDRFEQAVQVLEKLQQVQPGDTTGTRPLWGRGWSAFTNRNYSGAIGYWTVLGELYPRSNYNRSGLYWSARSHEKLGNVARAQELYQAVIDVDFTDIYRRHALERLARKPSDSLGEAVIEPWPVDEALSRAELLLSLGLDGAALVEIDGRADVANRRALEALRAKALAAKGERRQSIIALRRAFPVLGTPHQSMAPKEARLMYYPRDFQDVIEEHSRSQRISSHLVFGLIRQESAFDTTARSWAGAQGLMQIMPSTGKELARRLGLRYSRSRLSDPDFSVRLGTSYLRQVLEMFEGEEVLALAGYNAGPYRIKKLWRQAGSDRQIDQFLEQLSYEETRNYVKRVLLYSDSYRRLYEPAG